jgi:hypothetical protein
MLALSQIVEIDFVDPVHDLPHELAGFHVVVGILEHVLDYAPPIAGPGRGGEVFQRREQLPVDEGQKLLAGDALAVRGPGPPLVLFRYRRAVIGLEQFQFLILIVDDLEEKHPAQLADALRVAIDAGVLAHDVLDRFNGVADGHLLRGLLVKGGLQFMDSMLEALHVAKRFDELHRGAERAEGRDAEHVRIVEV